MSWFRHHQPEPQENVLSAPAVAFVIIILAAAPW